MLMHSTSSVGSPPRRFCFCLENSNGCVFRQHLKAKTNKPTVLPNLHLRRQILPADFFPLQQLRQRVEQLLRLGAVPERDVAPRADEVVGGVRPARLRSR
jgi:hypothetical protein